MAEIAENRFISRASAPAPR